MTKAQMRKPFEPVRCTNGRFTAFQSSAPEVRNRMTTITVSQTAHDVIHKEILDHGGSFGGIAGLVVDYLARNGRLGAVLDEALSEPPKQ